MYLLQTTQTPFQRRALEKYSFTRLLAASALYIIAVHHVRADKNSLAPLARIRHALHLLQPAEAQAKTRKRDAGMIPAVKSVQSKN
jgi:hypothetical protein